MGIFNVSSKAADDLYQIGAYTQDKWGVEQRRTYLQQIDARFNQLANTPDFPTAKNLDSVANGYFMVLINEHMIIYRKYSYGVRIVRVLSQSMDYKHHI